MLRANSMSHFVIILTLLSIIIFFLYKLLCLTSLTNNRAQYALFKKNSAKYFQIEI